MSTTAPASDAPAAPTPAEAKKAPTATEALQHKLMGHLAGFFTVSLIALGDDLGLFTKMKELGKCTSAELAAACGASERFIREWLYQQACAGMVSTDDRAGSFWLDQAQAAVLAAEHGPDASPAFAAAMCTAAAQVAVPRGRLLDTFRTGRGFDYDTMGQQNVCSTCRALGVWVRHFLLQRVAEVEGLALRLDAGACVADVGCGAGEVLFTLAKAYPKGKYVGYDISAAQIAAATARKGEPQHVGLDVTFLTPLEPGQGLEDAVGAYDLIITMDAVHDMSRPDRVLPLVRKALKTDGAYIINDPRGKPTPAANIVEAPDFSSVFYGFSCHSCLPSGTCGEDPIGYGTLGFQEAQARELAVASGFTCFDVLDWQSPMNNVFMLRP